MSQDLVLAASNSAWQNLYGLVNFSISKNSMAPHSRGLELYSLGMRAKRAEARKKGVNRNHDPFLSKEAIQNTWGRIPIQKAWPIQIVWSLHVSYRSATQNAWGSHKMYCRHTKHTTFFTRELGWGEAIHDPFLIRREVSLDWDLSVLYTNNIYWMRFGFYNNTNNIIYPY